MNIMYMIVTVLMIISVLLIRKTEKKLNLVLNVIIEIVLLLCYNMLVCYILNFMKIPINLFTLSIINLIVAILVFIGIRKKGLQQYYIDKKDIIFIVIFLIIVGIIACINFKGIDNIRYFTTDAHIHYIAAREFYENNSLLNNTEGTETGKQMMPLAYTNTGILFKVFEPFLGTVNLYKIFIICDLSIYLLNATLFYFIIKRYITQTWQYIIAGIVSIIYMIGYPLNSLICGFYYLSLCLMLINAVIIIIQNLKEESIKDSLKILLIALLNLGIISSYTLFAPVIYGSIFVYYLLCEKDIKQKCVYILLTLIIPGLIGTIYIYLPFLLQNGITSEGLISQDGYIYKSYWPNFVFFIPFAIYGIYKGLKEKQNKFLIITLIETLLYMLVLGIGMYFKKVSTYYFCKMYYLLWQLLVILFSYGILNFMKEDKIEKVLGTLSIIIYVGILTFSICAKPVSVYGTKKESLYNAVDIYCVNRKTMKYNINLSKKDVIILNYIKDNCILNMEDRNTLFIADYMQEAWIRAIFVYVNRGNLELNNYNEQIEKWNNGEYEYLICFENSNRYKKYKDKINLENANIIFETEEAKIFQK